MPEIINEKVNTDIKYNANDNDDIVNKVVGDFDMWHEARRCQIALIETIEKLLDDTEVIDAKTQDNNSFGEAYHNNTYAKTAQQIYTLKDTTIKRTYWTAVAHMYNSTFKNPNNLINVELQDSDGSPEDIATGAAQKASLMELIKKSRAKAEFKKAIQNWYKKGEIILYVNWKRIFSNVRRKTGFKFDKLGIDIQKWEVVRQLKYDGACIKCIEPENFVYDTSRDDDFENCAKIHRTWVTYSNIANNESYKEFIKPEDMDDLKQRANDSKKDLSKDVEMVKDGTSRGYDKGLIEVLEFQGDFSYEVDGECKFLPNMKIVVIGRKYVGCFQYNPNVINSYIYSAYEKDPDNGRGVPLLARLVSNSIATTETLNKINKALGLSINKCFLAPKGSLDAEALEVKENSVIEYDDNFGEGLRLEPLDFQSALGVGIQFLQFLEAEAEKDTGRFKFSSGDSPKGSRTLGEVRITQRGQDALQAYETDVIYNDVVIPMFEKLGELQANFQDSEEVISFKTPDGVDVTTIIDDTVRQQNYIYTVIDTQTDIDKKSNNMDYVNTVMQMIAPYAAQSGQGMISVPELMNVLGSAFDQENPSKMLIQPQPVEEEPIGLPEETGILEDVPPEQEQELAGGEVPLL